MKKRAFIVVASALAVTAATVATSAPASASDPFSIDEARAELVGNVDPDVIDAMQDQFGLSIDGVYDRLALDNVTMSIEDAAETRYGSDYAGTWVDEQGTTAVVAVTNPAHINDIEKMGATAVIVDHSLAQLDTDLESLNAIEDIPEGVHTWSVDIVSNSIVVTADKTTSAEKFLADADVDGTIVIESEQPKTMYELVGGDAYYINGSGRCSIGFPVTWSGGSGFVTAGHCGSPGDSVNGYNQVALGSFQASTFPGSDYAWVAANSNWTATNWVNGYQYADVAVYNGNEAAVGSSVCRSGSTTGMYCGTIQAKNQTVYYSQGTVYGMTKTNVCAEPGDSGGSWVTGNSAQGVTSGGSGNCSSGGTTYFFPLSPILSAYSHLSLKVS